VLEFHPEASVRAAKHLVIALVAVLAMSGVLSDSVYAAHPKKPHHGKYSHYKVGQNADMFGGKYKAPKKQKLQKHSYKAH
jgi:hypothetical protein